MCPRSIPGDRSSVDPSVPAPANPHPSTAQKTQNSQRRTPPTCTFYIHQPWPSKSCLHSSLLLPLMKNKNKIKIYNSTVTCGTSHLRHHETWPHTLLPSNPAPVPRRPGWNTPARQRRRCQPAAARQRRRKGGRQPETRRVEGPPAEAPAGHPHPVAPERASGADVAAGKCKFLPFIVSAEGRPGRVSQTRVVAASVMHKRTCSGKEEQHLLIWYYCIL